VRCCWPRSTATGVPAERAHSLGDHGIPPGSDAARLRLLDRGGPMSRLELREPWRSSPLSRSVERPGRRASPRAQLAAAHGQVGSSVGVACVSYADLQNHISLGDTRMTQHRGLRSPFSIGSPGRA
jgi:hypothetical protein